MIIGVRYVNKSVFDDIDRCIIVANHNSHFDIVSIMTALPYRIRKRTSAVATIDYFGKSSMSVKAMRFFFNAILINRNRKEGEPAALDILATKIEKGQNIIIFPEGT